MNNRSSMEAAGSREPNRRESPFDFAQGRLSTPQRPRRKEKADSEPAKKRRARNDKIAIGRVWRRGGVF